MLDKILDPTLGAINTSLNLRQANQSVISSNIANADTPGYKAKTMEFEQTFRDALGVADRLTPDGEHPDHIVPRETDPIHPEIYDDPNGIESLDGNTVDRGEEMAKLSANQILYDAGVEVMKRKLGILDYAISEGGGNR